MAATITRRVLSDFASQLSNFTKEEYIKKLELANGILLDDPFSVCFKKGTPEEWTDSITAWPTIGWGDIFSYLVLRTSLYTNEQINAYRSLEGYSFFQDGHVRTIFTKNIPKVTDGNYLLIRTQVLPSQRQNSGPSSLYDVWILFQEQNGATQITSAHCTCMAGSGASCSHVAATLFKVEFAIRSGLNQVACTSQGCQWNSTFKRNVEPNAISNIDFTCPNVKKRGRKRKSRQEKRSKVKCVLKADKADQQIQQLFSIAPNCAFFTSICANDSETDSASEEELPSPLSSLSCNSINSLSDEKQEQYLKYLFAERFPEMSTVSQYAKLEKTTEEQSHTPTWQLHRYGRLTASIAHRTLTFGTRTNDPANILLTIFQSTGKKFETKATKWGKDNEETARQEYVKIMQACHTNFTCRKAGLIIHPSMAHLGASPDGIIECLCHGKGVLEIKCPETCNSKGKAAAEVACLKDGRLKTNHQYYTQVQTQMMVVDVNYCDFFIWSPNSEPFCERVPRDPFFIVTLKEKLDSFYLKYVLKELMKESC